MTSMDIAVLQLLTEVIVSSKKCGGRHPVSMRTIPISQAMIHGWVKIFLSISFLVGAWGKSEFIFEKFEKGFR